VPGLLVFGAAPAPRRNARERYPPQRAADLFVLVEPAIADLKTGTLRQINRDSQARL
jgi:hypothetical protein